MECNVSSAFRLIKSDFGERMHNSVAEKINKFTTDLGIEGRSNIQAGRHVIDVIEGAWKRTSLVTSMLSDVLMYLDRNIVSKPYGIKKRMTVQMLAHTAFFDHVLSPFKDEVTSDMHRKIEADRRGEVVDTQQLKNLTQMLCAMRSGNAYYSTILEEPFLAAMRSYLQEKAVGAGELSLGEYLDRLDQLRADEVQRVRGYMQLTALQRVEATFNEAWLLPHLEAVMNHPTAGFLQLCDASDLHQLTRVARYACRVPALIRTVETMFMHWIETRVSELLGGELPVEEVVRRSAQLHQSAMKIANEALSAAAVARHGGINLAPEATAPFSRVFFESSTVGVGNRAQSSKLEKALRCGRVFLMESAVMNTASSVSLALRKGLNLTHGRRSSKFADCLCDYLDKVVIDQRSSAEEVEESVATVVGLYKFLTDKDWFEQRYRGRLARRLLKTRSATPADRSVVARLTAESGPSFAHKLNAMLRDINSGGDVMRAFQDSQAFKKACSSCSDDERSALDGLDVAVLTANHWPLASARPNILTLPRSMAHAMSVFDNFYRKGNDAKKLLWLLGEGSAEVRGCWGEKRYTLQLPSAVMAMVLLQFNTTDSRTWAQLLRELGAGSSEGDAEDMVYRAVYSLWANKVLRVERSEADRPKGEFHGEDVLAVNDAFKSPSRLVVVKTAVPKDRDEREKAREKETDQEAVEKGRRFVLESVIVRVMKTRRTLKVRDLEDETVRQVVGFEVNPRTFKATLEGLIEREYIARDPNDGSLFHYIS